MRTTVTIDPDTEALLREEVRRTGKSFKRVLNEAIRASLARETKEVSLEPLFSAPFPVAIEDRSFNRLAEDWADDDTLEEMHGK